MSGIVCAVRGGPESQKSIGKAISLAKETNLELYFVYIVNLDFMENSVRSNPHTISQQMEQMGEFILLTAQAAADKKGVVSQTIVRHGDVTPEMIALCHELEADYLVLGRPRFEQENSLFTEDLLAEFIESFEKQTGATVVLPEVDPA
jgi:nucleotide-binding universal stress UspA family protein